MSKKPKPPEIHAIKHSDDCIEIAKHQDEYRTLFALNVPCPMGYQTVICWKFSLKARLKLLFTGKLWHSIMRADALQPICITLNRKDHYMTREEFEALEEKES